MYKFGKLCLIAIVCLVMLAICAPQSAEAGCGRFGCSVNAHQHAGHSHVYAGNTGYANPNRGNGTPVLTVGWRVLHPFKGNGVPGLRRLRGC